MIRNGCCPYLLELSGYRTAAIEAEISSELLSYGAAALDDPSVTEIRVQGSQYSDRIYSSMPVKVAILHGNKRFPHGGRYLFDRQIAAVFLVDARENFSLPCVNHRTLERFVFGIHCGRSRHDCQDKGEPLTQNDDRRQSKNQ